MLNKKTIAVVVPAYNEETQIGMVIESMPEFVDRIVVVNDCSTDNTAIVVEKYIEDDKTNYFNSKICPSKLTRNPFNEADFILAKKSNDEINRFLPFVICNKNAELNKIILINLKQNGGVGTAVAIGYKWCLDNNIDCIAKMDGDGQMDPNELKSLCTPILLEEVDYCKGNRFVHRASATVIPGIRLFGNSVLSLLTKIASGYWRISDTQTAYTAISHDALTFLNLYELYPRYGYPNDILIKLNIAKCTIKEVGIKPVYRVGENSKMRIMKVIPKVSLLLIKGFFVRLWVKYFIHDFHPLFLLYHMAFVLVIIWAPYLLRVLRALILGLHMSFETLFAFTFLGVSGFQSLLFAMWMDIQDNERLYK